MDHSHEHDVRRCVPFGPALDELLGDLFLVATGRTQKLMRVEGSGDPSLFADRFASMLILDTGRA